MAYSDAAAALRRKVLVTSNAGWDEGQEPCREGSGQRGLATHDHWMELSDVAAQAQTFLAVGDLGGQGRERWDSDEA